jgi:hypothetical protein
MPRRQFVDVWGVEWSVFDVMARTKPAGPLAHAQLQPAKAWLIFESAHERRRFSPLPLAWHEASPEELERLLNYATPMSSAMHRPES